MNETPPLPRHVQRDGTRYRARVKHDGNAFSRSFATQEAAEQFARAVSFILRGIDGIDISPKNRGAAIRPSFLRECQWFVLAELGDAYLPGLVRTRRINVCQHVRADGMGPSREHKGRGRFEVRVSGSQKLFSTLELALRDRASRIAKQTKTYPRSPVRPVVHRPARAWP